MEYEGSDLSRAQYEALGFKIDPQLRVGEPELMLSRWFDYADMHPVQATYLYAAHYTNAAKLWAERYLDIETADQARVFYPADIFKGRDLTSVWNARRCADRVGCPYDFVMEFMLPRALTRTFRRLPRPNQLAGEDFEMDLREAWQERIDTRITHSKDPAFQAHSYRKTRAQQRHVEFVVKQVLRRPRPHAGLLGTLFHRRILDARLAAPHFSQSDIEKAEQTARELDAQ